MNIYIKDLLLFLMFFSVLFFPWFIVNGLKVNDLEIQSEDTIPALFLPVALLKDKTIYLDNYYQMMLERYPHPDDKKATLGLTPYYLRKVDKHYLSAFPIMASLLSIPVYFIGFLLGADVSWESLVFLSRFSAALIIALCGMLMKKIGEYFLSNKKAALLSFVFVFATVNFASISQALWQHGVLELFSLLGVYFLLNSNKNERNLILSGLFFGFALISRPTGILPYILLYPFIFSFYKLKGISRYFIGSLLPIAFFLFYNQVFYMGISNQGYSNQVLDSWKTPFYLGFLGMFLSPSKGILVYSPVFIFSLVGFYRLLKENTYSKLEKNLFIFAAIVAFLHISIVSMWKHWYGGWSFGYRMASDILPYLSLLLIPYFSSEIYEKSKKYFYAVLIWSVGIELMGIAFFDSVWHAAYDRGYKNQWWLWSLQNSEIVFNIKRVLVKLKLINVVLP
ncbi:MAG: hypothetical protein AAB443_00930 [Patescibacteria group bacterium]